MGDVALRREAPGVWPPCLLPGPLLWASPCSLPWGCGPGSPGPELPHVQSVCGADATRLASMRLCVWLDGGCVRGEKKTRSLPTRGRGPQPRTEPAGTRRPFLEPDVHSLPRPGPSCGVSFEDMRCVQGPGEVTPVSTRGQWAPALLGSCGDVKSTWMQTPTLTDS